jgi:hypothetical protein
MTSTLEAGVRMGVDGGEDVEKDYLFAGRNIPYFWRSGYRSNRDEVTYLADHDPVGRMLQTVKALEEFEFKATDDLFGVGFAVLALRGALADKPELRADLDAALPQCVRLGVEAALRIMAEEDATS